MNMNTNMKKCQIVLMTSVLLANIAAPLIANVQLVAADATTQKKTQAKTDDTTQAAAVKAQTAKRIAAVEKDWDAKTKASKAAANKEVEVFVQLKEAPAYKAAPAPTGTKSNIKAIKQHVQAVVDDQALTADVAENITGTKVKRQSGYLVNGFSIKATPKEVQKLESQNTIEAVYPVQEYQVADTDALELGNAVKAWDSEGSEHKGDGIVIADIDTGIDVTHKDLSIDPTTPALTKDAVDTLKAEKNLPGKYYTAKVPYGYNYAENNDQIYDTGINSMHGMHVAGIMAADGTDYVKQQAYDKTLAETGSKKAAQKAKAAAHIEGNADVDGVAPHAQLLAMKVFGNESRNAMTPVIIKAIEDSVMLGADIMNLSLGSVCSGSADDIQEITLNNAAQLGVLAVVAAGNNGNYAGQTKDGTSQAKAIKEQETVGSPSSALDVLTVASENNAKRMVSSLEFVDEDGNDIFKDIKCDMNETATATGFRLYDTNESFQRDGDYNFTANGVSQVDGKAVGFNIAPLSDSIKPARERIDEYFANAQATGKELVSPMDQMTFKLEPRPQEYTDGLAQATKVDQLKAIYEKYYPKAAPDGNLGRGYGVDYENGYRFADGTALNVNPNQKIVMISQGELTQYERSTMARSISVQGLIIVADDENAKPGETSFDQDLDYDDGLPTAMVSHADGEKLAAYFATQAAADKKVSILRTPTRIASTTAGQMSYFSSWGLTPEMDFKPEITAPGGNIWSTLNSNQFGEMSGTSMATPFVSGAEALLLPDLKQAGLNGIKKVRAAKVRMENSATPVYETYTKDGQTIKAINSVRQQGAGAINVAKALKNKTLLSVHDKMEGTLSLKQINGSQSFKLDITNTSKQAKQYKIDSQTGQVYGQTTAPDTKNAETQNLHEYPIGKSIASITTSGGQQTICVKAGATKTLNVKLNISKLQAKDSWLEGFFGIQEVGSDNTNVLPIVAYYGDLDKEPIVDAMATTADSFYNFSSLSPSEYPVQGFGYTWDTATETYTYDPNDIWYSSNTNIDQGAATIVMFRSLALTRNAKSLHGYITDKKGKTVLNVNTRTNVSRSWCNGNELINELGPGAFAWSGDIISPTSGDRVPAPEGDYTYHLEATSQMAGAKIQDQTLNIHVDTTAPVVSGLKLEQRADGYYLVGHATDDKSGFGGFSPTFLTINGQFYSIAEGVLQGKARSKQYNINYKLNSKMAASVSPSENTVALSVEDFAHNWIDVAFKQTLSEGKSDEFKIVQPSIPTTLIKDEDDTPIRVPVDRKWDDNPNDPFDLHADPKINPYTYMESYKINASKTTAFDFSDSDFDPVNHLLRIKGNSPDVFYVNGQTITPNDNGSYNTWIRYDPNAVEMIDKIDEDLRVVMLTYSHDAAGQNIIEKRPIDLFTTNYSSPVPVVPESVGEYSFTNPRGARKLFPGFNLMFYGIYRGTNEEMLKELGYNEWDDFSQFELVQTKAANFPATYNVSTTSGDIHIINKTAGETATDAQTTIKKELVDATNVNRDIELQEGFNVIECYSDEAPTQKATSIVYYSSKTILDDQLTLTNFDKPDLADWDAKTKKYTLRGIAGDNIKSMVLFNTSTDRYAPENQVKLKDNQWSIAVDLDADYGFKQWTLLVTFNDGNTYKYNIGGFYDMYPPTLTFDNTSKWTGNDDDGYDVYTKKNTFTFKGIANDNANGYSVYVNGTHVLSDAGEGEGNIVAGTPHAFTQTFNLEKNHVSSFEWKIFDRLDHVRFITVRVHQGNS
ncbi:MAG: S8 family serine peptidase [Lactobacillaceae bacterium]|nr:S8 family serine peptidase [Lactobacillaceae bacterium]